MKNLFLPSADSPVLQWLGLGLLLLFVSGLIGGLIIWLKIAKETRFKRKRKRRHHRPTNPTLAQTGGLPPKRAPNQPPPGP